MVNKSTNTNKANSHLWPQIIEHKQDMVYGVGYAGAGFEHT